MEKQVVFRKWKDPFRGDLDNLKEEDDFLAESQHEEFGATTGFEELQTAQPSFSGKVITGEFGMVPLGENNFPSALYNLWVGHTNFPITEKVCKTIVKTLGVEIFRVWTPYRFWLGVGKLFNTNEILDNVRDSICLLDNPKMLAEKAAKRYE